ncbi:MAG: FGGY family carbohydrate kinase [Verrucomicrobiota bacterium]
MRALVFDVGSSSTRAAIFDDRGRARLRSRCAYSLRTSAGQAAELSPRQLLTAARVCFAATGAGKYDAIGGCAFWHGLVGLDGKRRPITPIYTWADGRSRADAARLRKKVNENRVLQRTGCMLRFPFWPAKLRWSRRTDAILFRRVRFWVSPSDWIFLRLFGELATSASMASATGLWNQTTRRWDGELCAAAQIDVSQLPVVRAELVPDVFCPIGDGAAGNLGCGANAPGIAAINLGTSAALRVMLSRKTKVPFGLFRYLVDEERYVCGGAVSNASNLFRPNDRASGGRPPRFLPERAPDWPEHRIELEGAAERPSPSADRESLVRDSLWRIAAILHILQERAGPVSRIIVSGGGSKSIPLLRMLAGILQRDLEIARDREASLRGSAQYVGEKLGFTLPPLPAGSRIRSNAEERQDTFAIR